MRKYVFILSLAVSLMASLAFGQEYNCYTILAGKDANVDGSVMMAHNEDDSGENIVNWYKVPAQGNTQGNIKLKNGGELPQADSTFSFLWLEMPRQEFADSYMNEYGLTIASNACPSREDKPKLKDGGISYWLRRIMAQRAKTAREAVRIAGQIIEEYGYASSGRSYCIADPEEAWVLAVVHGKHWVAQRVPDDEVAIIPNYYTIQHIDLEDTARFMGSDDIVDYAKKRRWYRPRKDGKFNFREAYGQAESLEDINNIARHWMGLEIISGKEFSMNKPLPFSVKPAEILQLTDLMTLLENHYEGRKIKDQKAANPHEQKIHPICAETNQYGFVAQLRTDMPADFAYVMWIAPRRPCIQPFVPWYYGVKEIPENFAMENAEKALKSHFHVPAGILRKNPGHAFYEYAQIAERMDAEYAKNIREIKPKKEKTQMQLLERARMLEKRLMNDAPDDTQRIKEGLFFFTLESLKLANERMKLLEK